MTEEKTVVLSETELDGLNQGKNVINIFVDLSKRSYNKSHIKKLKSSAGSTIEDSKTVVNEMKNELLPTIIYFSRPNLP